ncbi:MAG: hypothetical protein WDW38_007746 [Sanguina aurantia]
MHGPPDVTPAPGGSSAGARCSLGGSSSGGSRAAVSTLWPLRMHPATLAWHARLFQTDAASSQPASGHGTLDTPQLRARAEPRDGGSSRHASPPSRNQNTSWHNKNNNNSNTNNSNTTNNNNNNNNNSNNNSSNNNSSNNDNRRPQGRGHAGGAQPPPPGNKITLEITRARDLAQLRHVLQRRGAHLNHIHTCSAIGMVPKLADARDERQLAGAHHLLDELAARLRGCLQECSSRHFAAVLWAFAKLSYRPKPELWALILRELLAGDSLLLKQAEAQHLSLIAWGLTVKPKDRSQQHQAAKLAPSPSEAHHQQHHHHQQQQAPPPPHPPRDSASASAAASPADSTHAAGAPTDTGQAAPCRESPREQQQRLQQQVDAKHLTDLLMASILAESVPRLPTFTPFNLSNLLLGAALTGVPPPALRPVVDAVLHRALQHSGLADARLVAASAAVLLDRAHSTDPWVTQALLNSIARHTSSIPPPASLGAPPLGHTDESARSPAAPSQVATRAAAAAAAAGRVAAAATAAFSSPSGRSQLSQLQPAALATLMTDRALLEAPYDAGLCESIAGAVVDSLQSSRSTPAPQAAPAKRPRPVGSVAAPAAGFGWDRSAAATLVHLLQGFGATRSTHPQALAAVVDRLSAVLAQLPAPLLAQALGALPALGHADAQLFMQAQDLAVAAMHELEVEQCAELAYAYACMAALCGPSLHAGAAAVALQAWATTAGCLQPPPPGVAARHLGLAMLVAKQRCPGVVVQGATGPAGWEEACMQFLTEGVAPGGVCRAPGELSSGPAVQHGALARSLMAANRTFTTTLPTQPPGMPFSMVPTSAVTSSVSHKEGAVSKPVQCIVLCVEEDGWVRPHAHDGLGSLNGGALLVVQMLEAETHTMVVPVRSEEWQVLSGGGHGAAELLTLIAGRNVSKPIL